MRRYRLLIAVLLILPVFAGLCTDTASAATDRALEYKCDYVKKVYNSDNGLEGTAANCVFSSQEGFLWIGGYMGLVRYDGSDFKHYRIEEHTVSVIDITQDEEGNLWIGTNGDGIYIYDGEKFRSCHINSDNPLSLVTSRFAFDIDGRLLAGTKAGIFIIDPQNPKAGAQPIEGTEEESFRDMASLDSGVCLAVAKSGEAMFIRKGRLGKRGIFAPEEDVLRCCDGSADGSFYAGTEQGRLLKISKSGKVSDVAYDATLTDINRIYEFSEGSFWVCSDNGIALLEKGRLTSMDFPMADSVESACMDYQGGFWFASSREGLMQLYENNFSSPGEYMDVAAPVNSLLTFDDKLYVGRDDGLYCYEDGQQAEDEALGGLCDEERVRCLYKSSAGDLWIATWEKGLIRRGADGSVKVFAAKDSTMAENQVRCIAETSDGDIIAGTESGAFLISGDKIAMLPADGSLKEMRIMDLEEGNDGLIYAATDGDGIYVINDKTVTANITSADKLPSNVVMKLTAACREGYMWVVTGAGVCCVDEAGEVSGVSSIHYVNSLDFVRSDDGEAFILAGNGLFRFDEKKLLAGENVRYTKYSKDMGLPVDFTANSGNYVEGRTLYMCGVNGVGTLDLDKEIIEREVRLYVNSISSDGHEIYSGGSEAEAPAGTRRLDFDLRAISFIPQEYSLEYYMKGVDKSPDIIDEGEGAAVGYTNLGGGKYSYTLRALKPGEDEVLDRLTVKVKQEYTFTENPKVRVIFMVLAVVLGILIYTLFAGYREKRIARKYQIRYLQEKNEEISRLAYKDLTTGAFNRNLFQEDRKKMEDEDFYAFVSLSVNHTEYIKNKCGMECLDKAVTTAVKVIESYTRERVSIYRVSENTFYYLLTEPVNTEEYVTGLKELYRKTIIDCGGETTLSVGIVCRSSIAPESIDELIGRCEEVRHLDEKHAEKDFVEGRVRML